jgi:carboxypeptidase Q
MKRFIRSSVLLVSALVFLGAQQDVSVVDKIIDEGRNRSEVMAHLDHLTNKIGPRLTSSDRLTQACEWAKSQFEKWGLKNCRLEQWGTFPVGFNRGPWSGKMTEPEELALTFTTNSWSPGTQGPQSAEAIMGPSTEKELEEVQHNLAGKWVLSPGVSTGRELSDKIRTVYDKAGILGLIGAGRIVKKSKEDPGIEVVHTGGNRNVDLDKLPTRCSITLLKSHYDRIKALLGEGKRVKLTFDIKNEFKKGPIPLFNVLAEIPGSEKPEEMVIVGGHIDSWDGATGTTDNGTGTCTTLEAARLLMKAGAKPRRTIRFMLWSGEEQGLLGSVAYVKAHPEETPLVSAVLVHDMGTQYVSGIPATKAMVPIFEKVFEKAMTLNPDMPFKIRQVAGLPGGGSDHQAYLGVGVPGLFWDQSGDKAHYPRTHHTQFDTYDAAIKEYQQHTSMVVAIGAYNIANLDELLPRKGMQGQTRILGVNTDQDGLTIAEVTEGSAAERAGLKAGDKILKLAGKEVKSNSALVEAIQEAEQKSTVTVMRGGKEIELKVSWDRAPGFRTGEDGITVTRINDNTPFSKAGLKEGDRILKIDGRAVAEFNAIRTALREGGKKFKVVIQRAGAEMTLEVQFEW